MTQIIPDNIKNEQVLTKEIDAFFHRYINSSLLKKCGFYKRGGFPCISILRALFTLVFTHTKIYGDLWNLLLHYRLRKIQPIGLLMRVNSTGKN